MFKYQTILRKIEQWVDKLPYQAVETRIELPQETIVLSKERQKKIGFDTTRCKK